MYKPTLIGAAGAIGKSIADTLTSEGCEFRVVGRDQKSLSREFGNNSLAEIVVWNPDDPASARAALRNSGTLIYLIGVPYDQFHLHPIVMGQTLEAAIAEGVEKMILVGPIYSYGLPRTQPVTPDHPREPHTYKGRMRKQQEDLLLDAHARGRIRGATLRLPDFYGPGVEKSYLDSLFKAAAKGGTANMLGPIDTPHQFVFVPDVGPVVDRLMRADGAWGHVWHFAGSGVATQRDLAERVYKMAGRKPRLLVAGKTMLRVMGLFNPVMRELVEMHYLLTNPVVLEDAGLVELIGPVHRTAYDEGLRLCLEAARRLQ